MPEKNIISTVKGNERILFVDDDEFVLHAAKMGLERFGYEIVCEMNASMALDHFTENPDRFHLVICDMAMPCMTGLEFVKRLRNVQNRIPVIMCTGQSDEVDERKAKQTGVDAFVLKPIRMKDLARLMRTLIDAEIPT